MIEKVTRPQALPGAVHGRTLCGCEWALGGRHHNILGVLGVLGVLVVPSYPIHRPSSLMVSRSRPCPAWTAGACYPRPGPWRAARAEACRAPGRALGCSRPPPAGIGAGPAL